MNLEKSIENLYSVFSKYPTQEGLRNRSRDCCVTDDEIKQLLSKPLKELRAEDISNFMTSATTTFGDLEDYKHFLPRVLELMMYSTDVIYDFMTFEKLDYNKWSQWNLNEIVEQVLTSHAYEIDKHLYNVYNHPNILSKIENLYFRTKDKELANRISIAYSILENNYEN